MQAAKAAGEKKEKWNEEPPNTKFLENNFSKSIFISKYAKHRRPNVRMAYVQNERCSSAQYLCGGLKQWILLALWPCPNARHSWPERLEGHKMCVINVLGKMCEIEVE